MNRTTRALALSALAAFLPALAAAQDADARSEWDEEYGPSDQAAPYQTAPQDQPAPPAANEGAEAQAAPPPDAQGVPSGQWVRTDQYGWVWMPYADAYTYVPPDGYGEPYMYVWAPTYGWSWLAAPWVWGFGPWPYFGVGGCVHFGWYGHGWWRTPGRWHWEHRPFHASWGHVGGYRPGGGYGHGGWNGGRGDPGHGGWNGGRGNPGHGGSGGRPAPGSFTPRGAPGFRSEGRGGGSWPSPGRTAPSGGRSPGSFGGHASSGGGGGGRLFARPGGFAGRGGGGHGLFGGHHR